MAIQIDIENSSFGVPFPSAYCRIVVANVAHLSGSGEKHVVVMDVSIFANVPQNNDVRPVEFRKYNCFLSTIEAENGDTFLAKCYSWLMQQPELSGAVAV